MAVPALVIGLGGTGQWVVLHLKKSLLETYGRIPTEVKLRSFDTVRVSRAGTADRSVEGHQERVEEHTVAGVKLEPGEYIHVGGYIRDLVREIAQDEDSERFPHLRSWFQARYYLDNLPDGQFHLDEGAGQFRQLGRMAIFNDLRASTTSLIYGQLQDTIQELQRQTNTANLQVFVVGSLAGGTGAGMFVDVAHLVRQIATVQSRMQVTVRGFLVLPDAFGGSIAAGNTVKRGMNARAFAAMRENKRFAVSFDWDLGYPIAYRAPSQGRLADPVLEGALKGQLFDSLYYIDGFRRNFALFAVKLEHGVAPSVADMISAILDDESSGPFQEHTKNLQAVLAARGPSRGIPYYGSLGTYSIVFPIYHLVEGYAYRLALESLTQLLQPAKFDERTGLPMTLAADRNREVGEGYSGANAARELLVSSSIVDPLDPTNSVENTLLSAQIVEIAERFSSNAGPLIDVLSNRSLTEWDQYFAPAGSAEDILTARNKAEAELKLRLVDEVPASKEVTPREKPADGVHRIEHGVRIHKNLHLGAEQADTGQRSGGKYRDALNEYADVHLNRFRRMLVFKSREILNGRSAADPLLARSGKVGHYRELLTSLATYFDQAYQAMTRVMERRRGQGQGRSQSIAGAQNALADMKTNANDTRMFIGRAHKTQQEYLESEQRLIDIHKVEIMEQVVTDAIKQMRELVASAQTSLDKWVDLLCTGQQSVYAQLQAGKQQIDANRDKDADIECRLVLGARKGGKTEDEDYRKFKRYEEERYQFYVHDNAANQVATVLNALNWQVSSELQRGKPVFKIDLLFGLGETSVRKMDADPVKESLERLLSHTRGIFVPMQQNESVAGYLMYAYNSPERLAETIHARSGPLLSHEAEGPVPANYLRVWYGTESAQRDFMRSMINTLARLSAIGDPEKFARLVNAHDRFTCTLVHTIDLIELDRIKAYTSAQNEYMGYQGESGAQTNLRTILHLFPAEVSAVRYEERLIQLNQNVRMLVDDVVWQMEKLDNLRLFLFCFAYGMIQQETTDRDGKTQDFYRLAWTATGDRDTGEIWLTKPASSEEPSFIEALNTFNYIGRDVRYRDGFFKTIDYAAVRKTLKERQAEDLAARREDGRLGASDPANQGLLKTQELRGDEPVWDWLAQHDCLAELEKEWTQMLPTLAAHAKEEAKAQADYDLASVFILVLRDELARLKWRIAGNVPTAAQMEEKSAGTGSKSPRRPSPWARRS